MFRSKRRPLIFTQADHARFAATIALHWRERPPLPFDSFVRGVADHDRGYGEHDDAEIGVVDNARWVEIQRAGFHRRGEDPVVDLVTALHVRRLLSPPEDDLETAALAELDELIPTLVSTAGATREAAEVADAVTNVCDRIAFAFPFEEPASGEARGTSFHLDGQGIVELDPWPLDVPELRGLIPAFAADGYPERLVPTVVPFELRPLR
ncbi:MAG TPA: DUF3891 family protein [Gaiellaceae bacterium]|nr:DUF3891 family protein [Gaiellaceae bacterium]